MLFRSERCGPVAWDLYNYVVGAYGGRIDQLFSIGGDEALNKGPKAIVNRFKPVVKFEGPFLLGRGEKKRHVYTMPNYNGRVKVMVVAGDGKSYGNAEKSVFVRQPVMFTGELVKFDKITGMKKVLYMVIGGVALLVIGLLWNLVFPINKNLWTSSFVCVVGAYSVLMFALFYYLIDVKNWRSWILFFVVIGMICHRLYRILRLISLRVNV